MKKKDWKWELILDECDKICSGKDKDKMGTVCYWISVRYPGGAGKETIQYGNSFSECVDKAYNWLQGEKGRYEIKTSLYGIDGLEEVVRVLKDLGVGMQVDTKGQTLIFNKIKR